MKRFLAAEFPNDNPDLHDGALWICPEVCSAPRPLLIPRAAPAGGPLIAPPSADLRAVFDRRARPDSAPTVVEIVEPESRALPELEPPAAPAGAVQMADVRGAPFERFVDAMVRAALAAGGSRAAAVLPALLEHGSVRTDALDATAIDALRRCGLWAARGPSPQFLATLSSFRATLRGESADLAACGKHTLDRWAAQLLAALLGSSQGRAEELRRDLRRSGVAAFGMLELAA